jgi:hypothetical protein
MQVVNLMALTQPAGAAQKFPIAAIDKAFLKV